MIDFKYQLKFICYCVFLFLISGSYSSFAQTNETGQYPAVNIVSPTASAIAKHVDFPVNLHTGVPDISIPIYTVKEGPLQIPISLSYHASGLKVMEPASWVGAGWSLNAGGVVSRNVKGLPDESVGPSENSFFTDGGFSNYFLDAGGFANYFGDMEPRADYRGFLEGRKDGEPDIFTFNFPGYSGKFYFREDLTPVLIPDGDLKIEPLLKPGANLPGTHDYIQGFKIVAPDGTKFYFGVTDPSDDTDPVERSRVFSMASGLSWADVISSWYLYKIESVDNKFQLNLIYRKEDYGYVTTSTKNDVGGATVTPNKIVIDGVALDEIRFFRGSSSVKFIANNLREDLGSHNNSEWDLPNTSARSLDRIEISSTLSAHSLTYQFAYDYFFDDSPKELPYVISQHGGSNSFVTDRKRLKLNSIQQFGSDNSTSLPPYIFTYYDQGEVPRRLSFGQDHWGFNNGIDDNTTMKPPTSTDGGATYSSGDDREARWPAMRAGALKLIQYPTGGATEFTYEPNEVELLSNCTYTHDEDHIILANAGMGVPDAEFGTSHVLEVSAPAPYYLEVIAQGTGASGSLFIDGEKIVDVNSDNPIAEDFIFLNEGTYTIRAYAHQDNGAGVGVLAYIYQADANCNTSASRIVGGLRIKEIEKFGTVDSPLLSMSYEYDKANLYSIPTYVYKFKNEVLKGVATYPTENGCAFHDSGKTRVSSATSPVSAHPMQTMQGYHIGYGEVKELFPDGGYVINVFNGSIKFPGNWTTLEDVCVRAINVNECTFKDPVYPAPPLEYDFSRGKIKRKEVYDNNNNKIQETLFSQEYQESDVGSFGVTTSVFPVNGAALPTHYELKSAKLNWTREINKTYDENGNSIDIEQVTYFNSPYHHMPSGSTQTSVDGVSESVNIYVPDLTECLDQCQTCISDYLVKVNTLLSEYSMKKEDCSAGICSDYDPDFFKGWPHMYSPCGESGWTSEQRKSACQLAGWIDYQYRLNEARVQYVNDLLAYKATNSCISDGIASEINSDEVKTLFNMAANNQLSRIEVALWRDNIFQNATFFDYESNDGFSNHIYLKDAYTTELDPGMPDFNTSLITSGALQKDPHYRADPSATFRFDEGLPIEVKEESGTITSYIWGADTNMPVVKATGVESTVLIPIYYNSPEDVRDDSALSDAQIVTYTHDPLLGMTSMTDPNGQETTFEYDKLGRLIRIKDHEGRIIEEYEYTYRSGQTQ